MKALSLCLAALAALALAAPAAAETKPRFGVDRGGFGPAFDRPVRNRAAFRNTDVDTRRPAEVASLPSGCPTGLVRKASACVAAAPARAAPSNFYDARQVWIREGTPLENYPYHLVRYPDRYRLPLPAPDQRYAIIGNQMVLVDAGTGRIVDLLSMVRTILD